MRVRKVMKLIKKELDRNGFLDREVKDSPINAAHLRLHLSEDEDVSVLVTTNEKTRGFSSKKTTF